MIDPSPFRAEIQEIYQILDAEGWARLQPVCQISGRC